MQGNPFAESIRRAVQTHGKSRIEDGGSKNRTSILHPRSSILHPPSSILAPLLLTPLPFFITLSFAGSPMSPIVPPSRTKEGPSMFYHTESKPQGWRAVAVFDDRGDRLIFLGRSNTQVRAGFADAYFEVLDEEERNHV